MKQRITKHLLFLFVCAIVVLGIPWDIGRADFRCVDRNVLWIVDTRSSELYVIRHGKLYLRIASRAPSTAVQWAWPYTWTPARLKALEEEHPEVKGLWPDPAAENRGVWWLEDKK
ncbi:hypothetical protein DB346_08855 [Verrucomicrobia bacterium LW23]|nr:hypothetical protein DB346_08855 [Verrucomicrobia bacterium LW23]